MENYEVQPTLPGIEALLEEEQARAVGRVALEGVLWDQLEN